MDSPKVSIIVPVYNAEPYLRRCLDSIQAQTVADFEVILVDDGSTDESGAICDEYAEIDSRIRVFHKENGGVAAARQQGLDESGGEYVIHADPDDWVEPKMLEMMYNEAKKNDADVVICDFYVNDLQKEYRVKQQPSSLEHLVVLSELFQHLHGSCWNKLVRRSCLERYGVNFPQNVSYCEDLSFWVSLFKHPVKIVYLSEAFYHYVQHSDSIVHSYMNKEDDDGWKLMNHLENELRLYPEIKKKAQARTAFVVVSDAIRFGQFNSLTFFLRYVRYVPFLLRYNKASSRSRLLYAIICLGGYSFFKSKLSKV